MYRQLCAAHNNNSERKRFWVVCVCVCVLQGGSLVFNFKICISKIVSPAFASCIKMCQQRAGCGFLRA